MGMDSGTLFRSLNATGKAKLRSDCLNGTRIAELRSAFLNGTEFRFPIKKGCPKQPSVSISSSFAFNYIPDFVAALWLDSRRVLIEGSGKCGGCW